jgi:hypothetical protein
VYELWFDWAQEIKGSSFDHFERREVVRAMLGALIRHKDRRRLEGPLSFVRRQKRHLAGLGGTQGNLRHCVVAVSARFPNLEPGPKGTLQAH